MARNGISTLATKEDRLIAKLELAQTKRQLPGTPGRALKYYDINLLPTKYVGNTLVNNPGALLPGHPWKATPNTVLGLWRTVYNDFWQGDPAFFDNSSPVADFEVADFSIADFGGEYQSYQWLGYFRAPHTASYQFYMASDDDSAFWIGDAAITAYTLDNSTLFTDAPTGEVTSDPIALTEGQYYPIRVQYGNNSGTGLFNFAWSDNYVLPPVIQVADLQYAGAQWTGTPVLNGATYTNAGWDYIGFNNAGLYESLSSLLGGDGQLAVTWSAGSTAPTGYVRVNFDGNTTFQFVPVTDASGNDNYPGTWVFPATFSAIV